MDTENITIKPQTIKTSLILNDRELKPIDITIKTHGKENCISIGRHDIFFDKDGNYSGEGLDLRGVDIIVEKD